VHLRTSPLRTGRLSSQLRCGGVTAAVRRFQYALQRVQGDVELSGDALERPLDQHAVVLDPRGKLGHPRVRVATVGIVAKDRRHDLSNLFGVDCIDAEPNLQ